MIPTFAVFDRLGATPSYVFESLGVSIGDYLGAILVVHQHASVNSDPYGNQFMRYSWDIHRHF